MAKKTRNKNFFFLILGLWIFSLWGCGTNSGTEVGNPTRTISGSFTANPVALKLKATNTITSCPGNYKSMALKFITPTGEESTTSIDTDGSFKSNIDTLKRYEIRITEAGTECGALYYAADQSSPELRVTLGKGDINVDLGALTDNGNGIFIAQKDPSKYCDDDNDGLADSDDDDINGDNLSDDDDDNDLYGDWFFESENNEI